MSIYKDLVTLLFDGGGEERVGSFAYSFQLNSFARKTYWKQWTVGRGGERGSGISTLIARDDVDDDDDDDCAKNNALCLFPQKLL